MSCGQIKGQQVFRITSCSYTPPVCRVQSKAAAPSKKNAVVSSFMAGAVASMLVFSPLQLGAIELPDGWAESTTDEGRTYYYNIKTKQSQFEAPAGAGESAKSKAKRISDQNNLNKIEKFDALPAVPVDKVSVYKTPTLEGGCGDEDYRVNSVECGTPAKNVVEDVAEKSLGTLSILGDQEAEKKKAVSSAQRDRMLQQAELEALKKTALFQKLDAKTKDPEAMEKRKKQIEEITARNDIGAQRAPWTPPDRDGDGKVHAVFPSVPCGSCSPSCAGALLGLLQLSPQGPFPSVSSARNH